MKIFRRFLVALLLTGLLQGVNYILDKNSPATIPFHKPFIFCLQLAVIIWLIVIVILGLFKKNESWAARFLPVLLALLIIGGDMWFNYLLNHPEKIPAGAVGSFSSFYDQYEKNDIIYEPCTVYDSIYGPEIIPGLQFVYGNIEYQNQYGVNSESFRSAEGALFGPEVIVIGGSQAFGVGVQNKEIYSAIVADSVNKVVLNAACIVPGTNNQIKKLHAADTSILQYLVIQLDKNDIKEFTSDTVESHLNRYLSVGEFEEGRKKDGWRKEYFPGKYFLLIGFDIVRDWFGGKEKVNAAMQDWTSKYASYLAKTFGESKYKIVLIFPGKGDKHNSEILTSIKSSLQRQNAAFGQRVLVADVSNKLTVDDYFKLDEHMRPSGHKKVAESIIETIRQSENVEPETKSNK